jgi:hypothetical protein
VLLIFGQRRRDSFVVTDKIEVPDRAPRTQVYLDRRADRLWHLRALSQKRMH